MDYIGVAIVSAAISIITAHVVTNIKCHKQLDILDKLFRDATEGMKDACRKISAEAQKAIAELHKNNQ